MKQRMIIALALVVVFGGAREVLAQDSAGLREAAKRVLASEGEARGEASCDVLRAGIIPAVFGVEPPAEDYRPGSKNMRHGFCSISWDKPNREELDAARADYQMKKAMAQVRNEDFDEPMPPPGRYRVSLTIIREEFDSAAAAVTSLEATILTLQEIATPEDFDGWIDGVGDRAAWLPKIHELQVAHAGVRYAITVSGGETAADNEAKAIELAQRIAAGR